MQCTYFPSTRGVSLSSRALSSPATRLASPLGKRPAARTTAAPRAAATAAPPPAVVWESTGVPLLDELAGFTTLQNAGLHGAKLVLFAVAGIYAARVAVGWISSKAGHVEDAGKGGSGFNPVKAVVASACKPLSVLLSFYGGAYSATVLSSLVQVAAGKYASAFNAALAGHGPEVLAAIKYLTQLVQDCSEVTVIIGLTWTALNLKDHAVAYAQNVLGGSSSASSGLARIATLAGSLLSFVIYASGLLASLAAFGINPSPLLASLGASSVVIGLATQRILGNVASAVTLYTSPLFAPGDSVKFLSDGGGVVVEGTIIAVEPMRTLLKLAGGSTLYMQNSKVVELMVQNDSQKA